jgi:hypothetical protein
LRINVHLKNRQETIRHIATQQGASKVDMNMSRTRHQCRSNKARTRTPAHTHVRNHRQGNRARGAYQNRSVNDSRRVFRVRQHIPSELTQSRCHSLRGSK